MKVSIDKRKTPNARKSYKSMKGISTQYSTRIQKYKLNFLKSECIYVFILRIKFPRN